MRRSVGAAVLLSILAATPSFSAGVSARRAQPVQVAAAESVVPAASGPAAALDVVIASDVHAAQANDMTRLVFDLSASVAPRAFVLADPNRVIIDLPEVNFQIDPSAGRSAVDTAKKPVGKAAARNLPKGKPVEAASVKSLAGVISSFRFGRFAAGKSRVVIELAEPARIVRIESEDGKDGQGARLVLDLARTDIASFALSAAEGARLSLKPREEEKLAATVPAGNDVRPVVVIDPGHGGIDVGAHGASSTLEKTIVFDFAKSLAARLKASDRYRVVMTRDEDIFVSLSERVKIARSAGAALFVSIHADTLSDAASVSGATVYTVSDKASDAEAARVAENENMADAAGGLDGVDDVTDVSDILFDLTRRETRAYSHVFARTLIGYIKEHARLNKNPQRAAGFRVLKAPDVPSVLLELGYLSSERDLTQLRSLEWREKTAASVSRAVDEFFAGRLPGLPTGRAVATDVPAPPDSGVARVIH